VVIEGQTVTVVATDNLIVKPLTGAIALAQAAPVTVESKVRYPAEVPLTLTVHTPFRVPGAIVTVPVASLAITTHEPFAVFQFAELVIATFAPVRVVDFLILPAARALVLSGQAPLSENAAAIVDEGTLVLAGQAPTVDFTSLLIQGDPKLLSLTVDRNIQFIATPTEDV
jgi:hypothetical protein